MRKPRLPEVYPTPRLAMAFAASSLWFFAVPWGGPLAMWLGFAANLAMPPPVFDTSSCVASELPARVGEFTGEVPWFCHNPQRTCRIGA